MNLFTTVILATGQPVRPDGAVGCATCWAAKYCAFFSLAGPPPPAACPLLPKPAARRPPCRLAQH